MKIIKRRRIPEKVQPVAHDKGKVHYIAWNRTIIDKKGRSKNYDFDPLAIKRPTLARHFMDAFFGLHVNNISRDGYLFALGIFWRFLDHMEARDSAITTLDQIDYGVIATYKLWLSQQRTKNGDPLHVNTQRKYYSYVKELLRWLLTHHYDKCSHNLSFPHSVFKQGAKYSTPREAYSKNELSRIVKAIGMELEEVNAKLENSYLPKEIGCDPRIWRHVPRSPWREWDNLVWYFEHKLGCKRRTQKWLIEHGHSYFISAAAKFHGVGSAVYAKLGVDKNGYYVKTGVGTDPSAKKKTPWMEWNNVIWYFENVLHCQHKSRTWLQENGHTSFISSCSKYHGGAFAVWDRLGVWSASTKQVLTPFLLLFSVITGANKTPILEMPRNCIKEDALLGRKYITWHKNRGDSTHRSWSPVARMIVERVIQLTEGLVPQAGADRHYLWLYNSYKSGVKKVDTFDISELAWFVKKYNLTSDNGSPMKLNMARMRPTFASRAFESCNGDLVKLRTLLGHRQIKTTQRYVRDFDKQKEDDRAFKGMTNILAKIRNTTLLKTYADLVAITPERLLNNIRNHRFFTGLGNCLDPYRSPMRGEQTRKRCRRFWSCLTCRHVLILDSDLPELFSHYYRLENFRNHMTKDAFNETYGFILKIIDNEIIPRFDKKIIVAARKKALALPALPLDLHEMCLEELKKI